MPGDTPPSEQPQQNSDSGDPPKAEPVNLLPGWRKAPDLNTFPQNPFGFDIEVRTPERYKSEFNALASKIQGLITISGLDALLIEKKLYRQGEEIPLISEEQIRSRELEQSQEVSYDDLSLETISAPKAIFEGVNRKAMTAKFSIDDLSVQVPIPSPRQKLDTTGGTLLTMRRMGTATFITPEGHFIASAASVPDTGEGKKIKVRTQMGTFPAIILHKDKKKGIALGVVETQFNIPSVSKWQNASQEALDAGVILSFNPEENSDRPQVWKLSPDSHNPSWLLGSPIYIDRSIAGILILDGKEFKIASQQDLFRIFPSQLNSTKSAPKEPSAQASYSDFFNPEEYLGLIQVEESNS